MLIFADENKDEIERCAQSHLRSHEPLTFLHSYLR